jgi:hypothetical protein
VHRFVSLMLRKVKCSNTGQGFKKAQGVVHQQGDPSDD